MQPFSKSRIHRLPALKEGDRIGAVAPASPFDRDQFFAGSKVLKDMGFTVVFPEALFNREGYLAGTDAHRLAMLHEMFADPTIQAVWCVRGGYGSMRLLPYLHIDSIRKNAKLFIGSSDITAMLNFLCTRCGMVTLHGPMITTLARADQKSLRSLAAALTESKPLSISADPVETIVAGRATGPVAGGNLSTLVHLLGTPLFPNLTGAIVFLEEIGEKPYRIDRMLTQMLFSGSLDRAAGICLGTYCNCGEKDQVFKVFRDRLSQLPIPVAAGFSVGHGASSRTLPIGLDARLDTVEGSLFYTESAVIADS